MSSPSPFNATTEAQDVVSAFSPRITGKRILITGISPSGLGEALASSILPAKPGLLIFTARSLAKAQAVTDALNTNVPIRIVQLDLSSLSSVRKAADEVARLTESIDVLVNNAGIMSVPTRTLTAEGVELHLATNYLGGFLFSNLLLPLLTKGSQSRIVNVSSGAFYLSPIRFSDLSFAGDVMLPEEEKPNMDVAKMMGIGALLAGSSGEGYIPMMAYAQSSTAIMLFTLSLSLSEKLKVKGVKVLATAPGGELSAVSYYGNDNQLTYTFSGSDEPPTPPTR
jgi:NAD(P)-dependent dehydrogenase (short-subunit alcohol dehydrogenase family)